MATMLFRATWDYFPQSILNLCKYIPADPFTRVRTVNELYRQYGKQIIREKRPEVDAEKRGHSKDIMSILSMCYIMPLLRRSPHTFRFSKCERVV